MKLATNKAGSTNVRNRGNRIPPWNTVPALCIGEILMNPNIDFLGICQLLKALRMIGFSESEIRKIARRIAVELGANLTIYP